MLLLLINNIVKSNICYMKDIYEIILKLKTFCHCNESRISRYCQISQSELKGIKAMGGKDFISCSDFSKKIDLSPSRSSRIIDNMVKKGLLLRKTSKDDRRSTLLYFTKKGSDLKENIDREEKKFEQLLYSKFDIEDIDVIKKGLKLLEKIIENNM